MGECARGRGGGESCESVKGEGINDIHDAGLKVYSSQRFLWMKRWLILLRRVNENADDDFRWDCFALCFGSGECGGCCGDDIWGGWRRLRRK